MSQPTSDIEPLPKLDNAIVKLTPDEKPDWYLCPNCGMKLHGRLLSRYIVNPEKTKCQKSELDYVGFEHS